MESVQRFGVHRWTSGGRSGKGLRSLCACVCLIESASAAASSEKDLIRSEALPPPAVKAPAVQFEELPPARTGIDFVYQWNTAPQYQKLLNSSAAGGGVCIGDYDGDG